MKQIKGLFEEIRGSTKHNTFKTYTDKRKLVIMTKKPIPSYTRTEEQDQQRTLFSDAVTAWNDLSEEEKQEYAEQARPYALTGYQYFIKQCLLGNIQLGIWYKVTIDNTANSNNLVEYQIRIDVSNDAQFFEDAENKKEAIRVYDSDRHTSLPYWIEEWNTTSHNARIWVKVPSIPAGGTTHIYISVNPDRTEDASSALETFIRVIPNLEACWHLDEGTGTTAYDTSGNGNNGIINGGAAWTDGKFKKALHFDGTDDYIDCGNDASLNPTNAITVIAWAKQDASTSDNYRDIIAKWRYGDQSNQSYLLSSLNNKVSFWVYTDEQQSITSTTNIYDGEWHHIAGTFDGSTQKIYIDGTQENSASVSGTIQSTPNEPTYIGWRYNGMDTNHFPGYIDEILIFNRALNNDEITDIYNNYAYTTLNYPSYVFVRKYATDEPSISYQKET